MHRVKIFKSEKGRDKVLNSYNRVLEMWSTEFQEHDVKTEFGLAHCITTGSKENPPLLLLHGVGDNSAVMWALNIKEISNHFYCIAVDTMGGPGKSVPNEKFRKNAFNQVEWINQIVDHFNLENFNIAGVSNGAYMAYNYTTINSNRVNRVVCMEGGMVTNPLKTMIQTLLMMFPEILIPTNRNLLKILKKLSSPGSTVFDEYPLLAEHLVLLMNYHNQQAMFAHKTVKYDQAKGNAIKSKLYFLIGDHRINMGKEFIEILNKGGYYYKVVPNAGHGINLEQPEIINHELIQFLKQENI